MAGGSVPEINVDEIMRKIREKVTGRTTETTRPPGRIEHHHPDVQKEAASLHHKNIIELADLTIYHDDEFVRNVYRVILKREADTDGFNNFLTKLRTGRLKKTEIIGRIRYSKEGRQKRVRIKGLALRFFILSSFRIPVLGYLVNLIAAVLRLPLILRNIHETEAFTSARFTQQKRDLADAFANTEYNLTRVTDSLKNGLDAQNLRERLALKTDIEYVKKLLERKADSEAVSQQLAALGGELSSKADSEAVSQQLAALAGELVLKADAAGVLKIKDLFDGVLRQINQHRLNIIDNERRITLLLNEARKRLPEPISAGQINNMLSEEDHALDAMYAAFQDRFRGTRDDIKERFKVYLPYVEKLKKDKPLLDLGSGRGEWLELMKEYGYQARGVDSNRVMVRQCSERGLEAVESDALEYLKDQGNGSLSAITGFHIVEHLPLKTLIMLIDESLRVLRPSGIVIFETPNPENLIVGACNFYTDPTHRNPIPPHTLWYLLEARGFGNIEIVRLHPYAATIDPLEGPAGISELAAFFHKEQDYSVIAYKA